MLIRVHLVETAIGTKIRLDLESNDKPSFML